MFSRRKFLFHTTLGALGAGLVSCQNDPPAAKGSAESKPARSNPNSKPGRPVVIATWDNLAASQEAMASLQSGSSALDAVEAGVKVVEADPENMTVGYGGLPDRDGHVTLDACIMDDQGNAGSVTFLKNVLHPVSVARKVMEETPHVMLSGEGAFQFAVAQGFQTQKMLTDSAERRWKKWLAEKDYRPEVNIERHDTIGMLALDNEGRLSGACTTSGLAFKMHGRVGDSPIIGAGLFVDNEVGAAVATGLGELVMKTLGSFLVVELMRQGRSPQEACEEAIDRIVKKYGSEIDDEFQVGYIALSNQGAHGAYSVAEGFNYTLFQGEENRIIEADFAV